MDLGIFDKLKHLKNLIDPNNHLRFHQFMYNINSEYYFTQYRKTFQVDMDERVYVRDMFYEKNEPFEVFLDTKIKELL